MSDRVASSSSETAGDAADDNGGGGGGRGGVGGDGREARRASRRGSRQASGQSFQRPPLKERIVSDQASPGGSGKGNRVALPVLNEPGPAPSDL